LLLREDGEFSIESSEMKSGDLLIKNLGEFVDFVLILLGGLVVPELKLSQSLVGERGAHDERGVTSGASEIQQTT